MSNIRWIKEQFSREHLVVYIGKTKRPSLKGPLVITTPLFSRHTSTWHPEWPSRCPPSRIVCALCDNCESQPDKSRLNKETILAAALAIYTIAMKPESRASTRLAPVASEVR